MRFPPFLVIFAKAGIREICASVDSRLRGNDSREAFPGSFVSCTPLLSLISACNLSPPNRTSAGDSNCVLGFALQRCQPINRVTLTEELRNCCFPCAG
jgi:hypothetical protein